MAAAHLDVTEKSLERWEKGIVTPKRLHLLALAKLYGIEVSELEEEEVAA